MTAVLVVLIGLNGDAGQGGVTGDVVGLAQESVSGIEAALEQFLQIDLATGGGQCVKIKIMDVDVSVVMRLGVFRFQYVHLIENFGSFGAVFQHGAHGRIAVDVGVVALQVAVFGIAVSDFFISFHQTGIHLPGPGALCPV